MSIFVGNLPFRAEQEDVIELFAAHGEVTNCALPLERDTGRKRGFAFVEMVDEAAEAAAIEALQGAELMGRPLRINKAEPRGSAPRRGGGGYGGGGGGGAAALLAVGAIVYFMNRDTEEDEVESSFVRRYKESNFRISLGSENNYDFNDNHFDDFTNQIDFPSNNFQLNLTYKFN